MEKISICWKVTLGKKKTTYKSERECAGLLTPLFIIDAMAMIMRYSKNSYIYTIRLAVRTGGGIEGGSLNKV